MANNNGCSILILSSEKLSGGCEYDEANNLYTHILDKQSLINLLGKVISKMSANDEPITITIEGIKNVKDKDSE